MHAGLARGSLQRLTQQDYANGPLSSIVAAIKKPAVVTRTK
jgi:hypothetical protein